MEQRSQGPLILAAFFAIYIIWGSTYLLNKIAVAELPPFILAGIRFISAGLLIFAMAALMGKSLRITKKQLINSLFAGFLFLSIGNGAVVWALKYVDSNFAALVISAQPLLVMLMMWILQGQRLRPMSLFGVVLGILGIYLLVSQQEVVRHEKAWMGILMIFTAMVSWAYGSLFVGRVEMPRNYFVSTGYQMTLGGFLLAIMSLGFGETWSNPAGWQSGTVWSLVLLILFGSIVAFTSFNYLLKHVSPEKVATNTYVNPIVAMLLGWYFLQEPITKQSVIAAVILLTGVYFINTKRKGIGLVRFRR